MAACIQQFLTVTGNAIPPRGRDDEEDEEDEDQPDEPAVICVAFTGSAMLNKPPPV